MASNAARIFSAVVFASIKFFLFLLHLYSWVECMEWWNISYPDISGVWRWKWASESARNNPFSQSTILTVDLTMIKESTDQPAIALMN